MGTITLLLSAAVATAQVQPIHDQLVISPTPGNPESQTLQRAIEVCQKSEPAPGNFEQTAAHLERCLKEQLKDLRAPAE